MDVLRWYGSLQNYPWITAMDAPDEEKDPKAGFTRN
jgi:hypothetical protein